MTGKFKSSMPDCSRTISRFDHLLGQFRRVSESSYEKEAVQTASATRSFENLLLGYKETLCVWRRNQEATADDFNILSVLNFTFDEVRHSMLLAWLLDSDMLNFGTHAQGSLGLRLFLNEFGLPSEYADKHYSVLREVAGDKSRMDIRVECRGSFIIDIENKILSAEGDAQTHREWSDLTIRAKELAVPDSAVHAILLTPEKRRAENRHFHSASYTQIARILDRFSELAKPQDVRLFASHYATALRRFIVVDRVEKEALLNEN